MSNAAYQITDPFPSIPPALLNSADIQDYVRATAMIDPFSLEKLKPASYEADFLGEVHYWNNEGDGVSKKIVETISKGKAIKIRKNSIVFVSLATAFCLPSYIALRFNLKITHVHRGLLLGTGPLVDPGFRGRLLVPLHNLTSDDYELIGGDGLIWIEFTKLSGNNAWGDDNIDRSRDAETRDGIYKQFDDTKKDITAEKYLVKASPHAPIVSSIPHLLDQAKKASDDSNAILRRLQNFGVYGGLILAIALGGMLYQVYGLIADATNYVTGLRKDMDVTERKFDRQTALMEQANEKIKALEIEIEKMSKKLATK